MDPFKLSIFSGPTSSLVWLLLFFLLNPPVLLPLMLGKMCLLLINRVMISNTESVSLFSSNARACQHTTEKGANLSLLLLLAPLGGTCCTYSRLRSYITLAVLAYLCLCTTGLGTCPPPNTTGLSVAVESAPTFRLLSRTPFKRN